MRLKGLGEDFIFSVDKHEKIMRHLCESGLSLIKQHSAGELEEKEHDSMFKLLLK